MEVAVMKKVFAVVLAVILVMSLSLTAFAAVSSPEGTSYYKVYVINGGGAKTEVNQVPVDKSITVSADATKGTFNKWIIYKADGTPAVEGVDYSIVSGTMTSSPLTIIPMANVIITGNYNGVVTKIEITNDEPTSPQTGDTIVYALGAVMLVALAGAAVAKKQLAK